MPEKASLSAQKQRAIAALVAGKTVAEAAADSHVNEATIYRWKHEQDFRDGLHQAKQEILDAELGKLVRYVASAIDCLVLNLQNDTGAEAPIRSVQVRAARAIVEAAITVHKHETLELRIEELEQMIKDRQVP